MDNRDRTAQQAIEFLDGLTAAMKIDCQVTRAEDSEDRVVLKLTGADNGVIIGRRGDVLDAVQYLTLLVANRHNDDKFVNIVLDAENYRERRTRTLTGLALRLADKAYRTGRKVELEPMNPFERRVIHSALQGSDKATTESQGEGEYRHVVIIPSATAENRYDPYAPCEGYEAKPITSSEFRKNGFGKMRRFGYKRSERR